MNNLKKMKSESMRNNFGTTQSQKKWGASSTHAAMVSDLRSCFGPGDVRDQIRANLRPFLDLVCYIVGLWQ
jgi:hypothetical protein